MLNKKFYKKKFKSFQISLSNRFPPLISEHFWFSRFFIHIIKLSLSVSPKFSTLSIFLFYTSDIHTQTQKLTHSFSLSSKHNSKRERKIYDLFIKVVCRHVSSETDTKSKVSSGLINFCHNTLQILYTLYWVYKCFFYMYI